MAKENARLKVTKCSACGKEVPEAKFCMNCGSNLAQSISKEPDEKNPMIPCPFCNRNVPHTAFCIACGNPLQRDAEGSLAKREHYPKEEDLEFVVCPLCREEVPANHKYCHFCGATIKKSGSGLVSEDTNRLLCPHCLKPNVPASGHCIYCGGSLSPEKEKATKITKPFNGFQYDVPYFFEPASLPLSSLRQASSRSIFPIKSTIVHSTYFGVKSKAKRVNFFARNFGGYDVSNLTNYLGTFLLVAGVYVYWHSFRYSIIGTGTANLPTELLYTVFMGMLLTALVMLPTWLSTFLVYRSSGYRLKFRLDSSRILMTIVFNIIWLFIIRGFGPIILRMGDFQDPSNRIVLNRQFKRGIVMGVIISTGITIIIAGITILVMGIPGSFAGLFLQGDPLKNHVLILFFGATWILLVLLLPIGDYFDKIMKEWNIVGYFILIAISFLILTLSFNLISVLAQPSYKA
ncbi:MAG: zinc ribbon domain-containing protein [Candidatus Heimdallarchaeota archaeon]